MFRQLLKLLNGEKSVSFLRASWRSESSKLAKSCNLVLASAIPRYLYTIRQFIIAFVQFVAGSSHEIKKNGDDSQKKATLCFDPV